jgi:isopenicillin N synthase-like dioxygenase
MSGDFPVIDIAAVRQPQVSAAARFEIARQVASACEEIGFFAVPLSPEPEVRIHLPPAESQGRTR